MTFYNKRNYSYLLDKDCSVVITGDSLAYNRYDFVEEPRENAYDCPLGMKSWSFLLRDFLIRSTSGWVPAKNFVLKGIKRVPYFENLPFFEYGTILEPENPVQFTIEGCPEYLYFITEPQKGALIQIDDKEVSLEGCPELHEGYNIVSYKSKDGKLSIKNGNSRVILLGGANSKTEVHMTGSGSKTAEWLISNYYERLGKYKPNLCILIIGANNRRMKNPKSFKGALKNIIENLKADGTEVILLTPPISTTTDPMPGEGYECIPNPEITQPILDATYDIAKLFNLTVMDLFAFFSGIPKNKWLFDNTHFTKEGNLMIYKELKGALFERTE